RWEPSDDTTIDLIGEYGYENDNRVRGDKQLCHRDPSGVIGCLPDALGFQPINVLSTLGATLGSKQGIAAVLNLSFGQPFATAQALGNTLGLFQLAGNGGPGDPAGPAGAAFLGAALFPNPFAAVASVPAGPLPDASGAGERPGFWCRRCRFAGSADLEHAVQPEIQGQQHQHHAELGADGHELAEGDRRCRL